MADGLSTLNSLLWGTSTGGAPGSGESILTLGADRVDARTPPTTSYIWGLQLNQVKNLAMAMSNSFKGGTRLQAIPQTANPFGATESGFYVTVAGTPLAVFNGSPVTLNTSAGLFWFNVRDYGAKGDGVTNDAPAIQAAVTAACAGGGAVFFPCPGQYRITSPIIVSSIYPVHLISNMFGYTDNQTTGNFIMPGANFGSTSMFRYQAPGGSHGQQGAGLISGLCFYDPNTGTHTPNYTMLAALDLYDFSLGRVENCMFHVLNGGAVRAVNWVMGSMSDSVVRYCGTGSQAAISLEPSGSNVQSTSLYDLKMEANYGTYLKLNSVCNEVKISHIGFEADTSTPSTCNTFVDNSGQQIFFSDIHLNRNTATQFINEAASNFTVADNLIFDCNSSQTSNPCLTIGGADHQFKSVSVTGATAQTTYSINVIGTDIIVDGVKITSSGGVSINTNAYVILDDFDIRSIPSGAGSSAVEVTATDCLVANGIVRSLPANLNGVRFNGACGPSECANVEVRDQNGTGAAFIDANSNNATTWIGNRSTNNTTAFSASASAYVARGNSFGGLETETVTGPVVLNSTVTFNNGNVFFNNGLVVGSGKVIDCSNTLFLGTGSSTAVSLGKTGTIATVNGQLKSNQGLASTYRSAATPVTIAKTDYFVGVSGSGARSVTLPAASTCMIGQQFVVQDIAGSTGIITITRAGSDTINGTTSVTLAATNYARQILVCDGVSAWYADTTTI